MIKFKSSTQQPSPVLFVQPKGGGQSLVRDVRSVLFRGVSLTIVPVLALGVDLLVKVRQNASQACGRIISIHLDEIQNHTHAQEIIDNTLSLPFGTRKMVMLFDSPQSLIDRS